MSQNKKLPHHTTGGAWLEDMEKVIKKVEGVGIDTLNFEIIWKQLRTSEYVFDLTIDQQ